MYRKICWLDLFLMIIRIGKKSKRFVILSFIAFFIHSYLPLFSWLISHIVYLPVILFDNHGMGESSVISSDTISIDLIVQDTITLVKYLGIKQFNLLGWSMGGKIWNLNIQCPFNDRLWLTIVKFPFTCIFIFIFIFLDHIALCVTLNIPSDLRLEKLIIYAR